MKLEEIKKDISEEMKYREIQNKIIPITEMIMDLYQLGFDTGYKVALKLDKKYNVEKVSDGNE